MEEREEEEKWKREVKKKRRKGEKIKEGKKKGRGKRMKGMTETQMEDKKEEKSINSITC